MRLKTSRTHITKPSFLSKKNYSQTSVFKRLGVRKIRFWNKIFEIKIVWFLNNISVLEQIEGKINLYQREMKV